MIVRVPDYFDQFSCLAGACPHSCCVGWEVVLDEETVQRYQDVPGSLGQRLRAAMRTDEEGDVCFPLRGGRCPFLNGDDLCEIHCALGEAATSVTCREHPRFTEEYGPFREITLSAACPKANELLLGSGVPLTFLEREDDATAEEGDEWLDWLVPLRDHLLALLGDRSRPLRTRLRDFLLTAEAAQRLLDQDEMEELNRFCAAPAVKEVSLPAADTAALAAGRDLLLDLEILEPDWRALLERATRPQGAIVLEAGAERAAMYFAFRHILKAVNDGALLARAELCVFAVLMTAWLAEDCGLPEALRLFSREIEHDEDNLEALLEAFQTGPAFRLPVFLTALSG